MFGTIATAMGTDVGLGILKKIFAGWAASASGTDLVKFTSSARVEPICLIDNDVMHHEMLPDVMQSLQSIFAGYYLQAMAISTNIGKIDVVKQLDRLNPNRSVGANLPDISGMILSTESYQHGLPRFGKLALEADKKKDKEEKPEDAIVDRLDNDEKKSSKGSSSSIDKEVFATVRDLTNLSVGKLLNVEITDGHNKATIPISIRLMASSIPSRSIIHILSLGNKDTTIKERYHGWKSGRLDFIRDIVFCQDLIDAHKEGMLKDKTGVYGEILKRRKNNAISTIISGNPSIATASNLLVCSKETIRQLEGEIGREFKDFKTRQKIFDESYLMIIAVIDKEWDRVTIYHRGINLPTEVGMRDLRVSNKGSGPDVSEILKAYQLGHNPSL